ncbi:MAG: tRNA 2-thiouridine(34) synthase MnmA [Oscillospiraceae bacterium]|nr:tRNA 2-thiouridine(34) synthase MnmA [Oscillospiraceae bacterium]
MTYFVGMSGGVDSSVAALLLKQQGHSVTGVTLLLRGGRLAVTAPAGARRDIADAERVCAALEMPHRVLDLSDQFCALVVDEFADAYLSGRTPNPCVTCNRLIKFGALLDYALENGADGVATGHYALVEYDGQSGRRQMFHTGSRKDQSYFLWSLSQRQLAHSVFPLAGMEKSAVRELARRHRLPVADKGDSMEVCFVPESGHAAFIRAYTGRDFPPGEFADGTGRVLGVHSGIANYTVGQRKGLGIALGQPMYVTAIDPEHNRVILGEEGRQFQDTCFLRQVNWLSVPPMEQPFRAEVKIRYQAAPAPAEIIPEHDGLRVAFDQPQRAVAPGQSAVFYRGAMVLGGGVIQLTVDRGQFMGGDLL